MDRPKLSWWIAPLFSLGAGLLTWLAAPYLPRGLTAAGLVFGIVCVLISVIATLWHFRSVLGRLAMALLMFLSVAFAAYASVFFWQKANGAPPQPVAVEPPFQAKPKPTLEQLMYRICDAEMKHVPKSARLKRLALEFDPINPNTGTMHIVGKRGFLIFDGVPSKNTEAGKSLDITPRVNVSPGTKVPNIKDWVDFNPPRRETGSKIGRYHYEFRVGRDEDNATQPVEINGTFEIVFGSDGRPVLGPNFGPSGDKNITFDPAQCPFSW